MDKSCNILFKKYDFSSEKMQIFGQNFAEMLRAVQEYTKLVDLDKSFQDSYSNEYYTIVFTCKSQLRYSRERYSRSKFADTYSLTTLPSHKYRSDHFIDRAVFAAPKCIQRKNGQQKERRQHHSAESSLRALQR